MIVSIDLDRGLCSLLLNSHLVELPIHQVVVGTDEALDAPVIHCVDGDAVISDAQARMLIGVGARDARKQPPGNCGTKG
ncbi:DUF3203 family protein [Metapseudomonas lalkuanensis]|nr:DUF3203 family protein [Pseudomonas lalkuanensis]UCO97533.1 DUF3203 family protein [Pseudomonas lalkuanensis]